MRCKYCGTEGKIYRAVNGNGAKVVVERCPACRRNTRPGNAFLSKNGYDWESLPMFDDYTKYSDPCSVKNCKNKDTELHHFAPRHLFSDAESWATAYLCKFHHDLWHKLTGTGSYAPRVKREASKQWQSRH